VSEECNFGRLVPRYDVPRFDIRTTKSDNGSIRYDIMHKGYVVEEIPPHELVELGMKLFSVLRHLLPSTRL
jgi:hypothetical protein